MFPLHHIIHSTLYICAELYFYKVFSQTFYHLVLSTAWEEKQCRNSTGEQPKILVSFPAWNHPTRDCPCVLTPSTRPMPLLLTGISPRGWAAQRTRANQTCASISSRICTCHVTFKPWEAWGRWDTFWLFCQQLPCFSEHQEWWGLLTPQISLHPFAWNKAVELDGGFIPRPQLPALSCLACQWNCHSPSFCMPSAKKENERKITPGWAGEALWEICSHSTRERAG